MKVILKCLKINEGLSLIINTQLNHYQIYNEIVSYATKILNIL
jgi:hypothetical protein